MPFFVITMAALRAKLPLLGGLPVPTANRTDDGQHNGPAEHQKKANPLTFPKSEKPFSMELFEKPTKEYRGCPLWSWNNKLTKDKLLEQIDYLKDMGFGGFHMHVRVGLDTEYLSPEFMDLVEACVNYAEEKDLLACL